LGQRLDAASGDEVGINDFRISDMGPNGDRPYEATEPAVAYNSANNEYLVVWAGDDNTGSLVHGEKEIFGQRINARTGKEVGSNDFRISDMGPDGNTSFGAKETAVAYNSVNNEYLVVWSGDDNTGALVDNEHEIFGQRLGGATGAEIGMNDFRISDMGSSDGDPRFEGLAPQAVYNSRNNEYLVVWAGSDDAGLPARPEYEIYGQRLKAATGAEVGANDFRICDMGSDGDMSFKARSPAVAYNSTNNEYLVVWSGDDNTGLLVNDEFEIFGQRLNAATGAEAGVNDFRISDMGTSDGNDAFAALAPNVAYNSTNNEYLVVWSGDDDTGALVDNEYEIFGQRLAADGAAIGENDFRISDMGQSNRDPAFDAKAPKIVYNRTNNVYLVVWQGDDDTGLLLDDELEIFGQRLDAATGAEIGINDFRVSFMGPNGNKRFIAIRPSVAYSGVLDAYLAVWEGGDDTELEIFGLRFKDGQEIIQLEQRPYYLGQNFPNPFNYGTEINLIMPESGEVVVKVYTVTGQLVRALVNRELPRGYHTIQWNGRNQLGNIVAAGVYYCRMTVKGKNGEAVFAKTNRMTIVK
jgi:predicted aconitase with swiveling domain